MFKALEKFNKEIEKENLPKLKEFLEKIIGFSSFMGLG
jgi:hypothetical protein